MKISNRYFLFYYSINLIEFDYYFDLHHINQISEQNHFQQLLSFKHFFYNFILGIDCTI